MVDSSRAYGYRLERMCVSCRGWISDHQQSWGHDEGPSKGPGPRSAAGRWFV